MSVRRGQQASDFARAVAAIDAAVGGQWRPAYGDLATVEVDVDRSAPLDRAHAAYARMLETAATDPAAVRQFSSGDRVAMAAALADARDRFGRNAVPLSFLTALRAAPTPEPSLPTGTPGPAATARTAGHSLLAQEGETTMPIPADSAAPTAASGGAPPGATPAAAEPEPPSAGRGLALGVGAGALVAIVVIVLVVLRLSGGNNPTVSPSAVRSAPATLPAVVTAAGPPPEVDALARACIGVPSGSPPAYQTVSGDSSGVTLDPATGLPAPSITVTLGGKPPAGSSPFSITVAVLPYQATPPPATTPMDQSGTTQLIAYWDGSAWHRGLRTWTGTAWSIGVDIAARGFDLQTSASSETFFWEGLGAGSRYGELAAGPAGCTAHGLDGALNPTQTYAG